MEIDKFWRCDQIEPELPANQVLEKKDIVRTLL